MGTKTKEKQQRSVEGKRKKSYQQKKASKKSRDALAKLANSQGKQRKSHTVGKRSAPKKKNRQTSSPQWGGSIVKNHLNDKKSDPGPTQNTTTRGKKNRTKARTTLRLKKKKGWAGQKTRAQERKKQRCKKKSKDWGGVHSKKGKHRQH